METKKDERKALLDTFAVTFLLFSICCLITLLFLERTKESTKYTIPKTGSIVGPIHVKEDNSVYRFKFRQTMKVNNWSYVTMEVLDKDSTYLYAMGDGFWDESGRDSEGYWHESDSKYSTKFVFHKKGDYLLKIIVEASDITKVSPVELKVYTMYGSSLGFYWLTILSFIIAVIVNEVNRKTLIKAASN